MMHFYPGLTDDDCLDMPFSRLIALYGTIQIIELEEELRLLSVHHAADPQKRQRQIEEQLRRLQPETKKADNAGKPTAALVILNQGVSFESEPGSIEAERARQKAFAEQSKREWEEQQRAARNS